VKERNYLAATLDNGGKWDKPEKVFKQRGSKL
jgi:hypothetical protein